MLLHGLREKVSVNKKKEGSIHEIKTRRMNVTGYVRGIEVINEGGKKPNHHGFEKQNYSPASSVTIAFPTGCVAPVTTQTNPYCEVTEVSVLLDALTVSHLRHISNSDPIGAVENSKHA
jgi:hypothetical protein